MVKVDPQLYSVAKAYAALVRAIAITETNEDMEAPDADGGKARGPFQTHPGFVHDYYGATFLFPADPQDTWLVCEIKAVATFFFKHVDQPLDLVVQAYNLGVKAVFVDGKRNPDYLSRFDKALNWVKSQK